MNERAVIGVVVVEGIDTTHDQDAQQLTVAATTAATATATRPRPTGSGHTSKYAHDLVGRDIFVHASHLPAGCSELAEGDQIELQVTEGRSGLTQGGGV